MAFPSVAALRCVRRSQICLTPRSESSLSECFSRLDLRALGRPGKWSSLRLFASSLQTRDSARLLGQLSGRTEHKGPVLCQLAGCYLHVLWCSCLFAFHCIFIALPPDVSFPFLSPGRALFSCRHRPSVPPATALAPAPCPLPLPRVPGFPPLCRVQLAVAAGCAGRRSPCCCRQRVAGQSRRGVLPVARCERCFGPAAGCRWPRPRPWGWDGRGA